MRDIILLPPGFQYSFWKVSCQYIIFPLLIIYHFSLLVLGFVVLLHCPRCWLVFIYFETELLSCIAFEKVLAIMYWILLSPFFLLEFVIDIYWAMSLYSLHFLSLFTYSVFICCILGKFYSPIVWFLDPPFICAWSAISSVHWVFHFSEHFILMLKVVLDSFSNLSILFSGLLLCF